MRISYRPGMTTMRDVLLTVARRPGWSAEVADRLAAGIMTDIPLLAGDPMLRDLMMTSNRENADLLFDMVKRDLPPDEAVPPPASVEFARQLVRRGVGVDVLLRGFHAAEAAFFRYFVEQVHATPELARDPASAITMGAEWTFAFVAALSREIAGRYAEERETWIRSAAAAKLRDVRETLHSGDVDVAVMTNRLRYPLDQRHFALVLWPAVASQGTQVQAGLERTANDLAVALKAKHSLVVGLEDDVVAVWLTGVDKAAGERMRRLRLPTAPGARPHIACGLTAVGLEGFRLSHQQAMHALRVTQLSGEAPTLVVRYHDVALTALASADVEHARAFVATELGPLAEPTDDAERLATTVRHYLESGSSPRRAAAKLGVHENTVKYRVRAAEELLGRPFDDRVAELITALRLLRVLRPDASPA